MTLMSIKKARNLKGKRVLVRCDFNVPVSRRNVLDNTRLLASLPTIEYLIEKKAKVILLSHLGRPKGKVVRGMKLDPVVKALSKLLGKKVKKLETGNWKLSDAKAKKIHTQIQKMKAGDVALCSNTRFSEDEKGDTDAFGELLASFGDVFVQECFAVAHRAHGSVIGPAKHLKSYAGLLLEQEIKGLSKVIKRPKKPFVVVLGGAKVETKIPVMKNLLPKADNILIGGGIVNTYLKAAKYKVGNSLVDDGFAKQALQYCKKKKVIKPIDVIVGKTDGTDYRVVDIKKKPHQVCRKSEAIFDIGPKTIQLFATYTKKASTLVWNGAMGYFEQEPYNIGTLSIARLVASRAKGLAYGVIGGGETLQAMDMVGMEEYVDLVSTGGGAMLEFLAGEKLPGIEAIKS